MKLGDITAKCEEIHSFITTRKCIYTGNGIITKMLGLKNKQKTPSCLIYLFVTDLDEMGEI
jgi:hypothetical protein